LVNAPVRALSNRDFLDFALVGVVAVAVILSAAKGRRSH
jgi:hypothetical protein